MRMYVKSLEGLRMWTIEQLQVINDRGNELLVAAGAGSGKTAVLVERILSLVLDFEQPVDIDKLLVVTFTNAAAAEMKERILAALTEIQGVPKREELARRQQRLLMNAPISTIHSFCMSLLRNHFHILGLDPGFRIGDAGECEILFEEALDTVLSEKYAAVELSEPITAMLDRWAGYRGDGKLRAMIASLYYFAQSDPWPELWLDTAARRLELGVDTTISDTIWGKLLEERARLELKEAAAGFAAAYRLADAEQLTAWLPALADDIELTRQLSERVTQGWDTAAAAFSTLNFTSLKAIRGSDQLEAKNDVKALRKSARAILESIQSDIYCQSAEMALSDILAMALPIRALCDITREVSRQYMRQKRRRSLVDFGDLEHLALQLLWERNGETIVPSAIALSLRQQFAHVMVDEYQDSNQIQELLLQAVTQKSDETGNLFMVGDVKQSIYRFRQAQPELFLEKYERYSDTSSNGTRRIILQRNFRSRPQVLKAVNFIFSKLMSREAGEMTYTETEALIPGADWSTPVPGMPLEGWPLELHVITPEEAIVEETGKSAYEAAAAPSDRNANTSNDQTSDTTSDAGQEDEQDELESVQAEAAWAAITLSNLVCGTSDTSPMLVADKKKGLRPMLWRDAVILMRATSVSSQVFLEELALHGIPAFADTGIGYFASTEVSLVMAWLRVLDNPLQDIPLVSVLRSFLFGFTEGELAEIRTSQRKSTYFDAMSLYCEGGRFEALQKKISAFQTSLQYWRDRSQSAPVHQLLWQFFDETGFLAHAGAMPSGKQRVANLQLLINRAARFENTSCKGLFQFIRFYDGLVSRKGDIDGAKILGEGENVVRIMSIHKSKGLEFPVVLLCGAGKRFNMQDMNAKVLMHPRLGLGPDVVRPELGTAYPTIAKMAIRFALMKETIAEEMRVLYVAMTRAKERLLMCGHMRKPYSPETVVETNSEGYLQPSFTLAQRSHLAWLLAAVSADRMRAEGNIVVLPTTRKQIALLRQKKLLPVNEQMGLQTLSSADLEQTVAEALTWQPPFQAFSRIPAKLSVTGIKHAWEEEPEILPDTEITLPSFLSETPSSAGAGYGTLMHLIAQHLQPSVHKSRADLDALVINLVSKGVLQADDERRIGRDALYALMQSDLYAQMASASELHREAAFTVQLPTALVFPEQELPEGEFVVVQGVIDCWFRTDAGVVLVDYKTDKDMSRLASYQEQLKWYARALSRMLDEPVGALWIWSFHQKQAIRVVLD